MTKALPVIVFACLGAIVSGCARERTDLSSTLAATQAEYWHNLEALCGKAFEGKVVEDSTADPRFARTPLVMHVMRCERGRLLIPFHIADDRSRTWVLTQTDTGLRLKHDHRHEDGTEDDVTQYGGDTQDPGTAQRQQFYADAETAEMLPAAATNVWTMEIVPGRIFAYGLERKGTDRKFCVEFDLSREVATPPKPWGW